MAPLYQHTGGRSHLAAFSELAHQPQDQQDRLLSARGAALWLNVNPRTAQLRARRALRAGDPIVRPIAGAYCAPEWC